MASLTELFSIRNISRTIERVKGGIPDREPAVFKRPDLTEQVIGNETTFHTRYGERRLVARTEYGAPSRATTAKKVGQQSLVINSYSTHVLVQQLLLLRLREVGGLMAQKEAADFVTAMAKDHATRYTNNRLASRVQMIGYGKFWYDINGNLLQSSSGATLTEDLGVPAVNLNQCDGIIDATWSNVATNIYTQIVKLQKRQVQTTGRPLKHAFYDTTIPGLIYANTSFKFYFQFNPQYYKAMTDTPGVIPDGFMNMDWHNMGECMFEKEDETVAQLFPTNGLTLTPDITPDVYSRFEGSLLVPKGTVAQAYPTWEAALANAELVHGIGGYSTLVLEPLSAKLVMVDNFSDVWKNPKDLVIPTVVF